MKLRQARSRGVRADLGERLVLGLRFAERERLLQQDVVRHDLAYERVDGRRADARQHLALRGFARADVAAREIVLSRSSRASYAGRLGVGVAREEVVEFERFATLILTSHLYRATGLPARDWRTARCSRRTTRPRPGRRPRTRPWSTRPPRNYRRGSLRPALRQLDVDEVAELLGGDRGDADGDGAVAVVGDIVAIGVLQFRKSTASPGSMTRSCRIRSPPLSVCLREVAASAACSFGEALWPSLQSAQAARGPLPTSLRGRLPLRRWPRPVSPARCMRAVRIYHARRR